MDVKSVDASWAASKGNTGARMAALRYGRRLISARRTQRTAQSFLLSFQMSKKRELPAQRPLRFPGFFQR